MTTPLLSISANLLDTVTGGRQVSQGTDDENPGGALGGDRSDSLDSLGTLGGERSESLGSLGGEYGTPKPR